jgi:hypothetical protein
MTQTTLVAGLVNAGADADAALEHIMALGYSRDDVSLMMSDETCEQQVAIEGGSRTAMGASVGGAVGGAFGAVVAAIAAIGTSVALPGLGLIVAGPIAAALMGVGAGGATGGAIGALIGSGIPEYRARLYETGVCNGQILLGVYAHNEEEVQELERFFKDLGAAQVRFATPERPPLDNHA